MTKLYWITVAALFCSLAFLGCDTTDCITFNTRVVIVDFLDSATEDPINRDFNWISAIDSELFFYTDTTLSKVLLPINTETGRTTFLFGNTDNTIDTLEVEYRKTERLISEDCGFDFEFKGIKIIYTTFDNALSLENELSLLNEENIKIFL